MRYVKQLDFDDLCVNSFDKMNVNVHDIHLANKDTPFYDLMPMLSNLNPKTLAQVIERLYIIFTPYNSFQTSKNNKNCHYSNLFSGIHEYLWEHSIDLNSNHIRIANLEEFVQRTGYSLENAKIYLGNYEDFLKYLKSSDFYNTLTIRGYFSADDFLFSPVLTIPFTDNNLLKNLNNNLLHPVLSNYCYDNVNYSIPIVNSDQDALVVPLESVNKILYAPAVEHVWTGLLYSGSILTFKNFTLVLPYNLVPSYNIINYLDDIESYNFPKEVVDLYNYDKNLYIFILRFFADILERRYMEPVRINTLNEFSNTLLTKFDDLTQQLADRSVQVKEINNGYTW